MTHTPWPPLPSLENLGTIGGFEMDAFDPAQFILAMASQLPTVECDVSPATSGSASGSASALLPPSGGGRVVRLTWWRPHGPTAIAPGLKRLSLKVRVAPPIPALADGSPGASLNPFVPGLGTSIGPTFGTDGIPAPPIMAHLLDVFAEHFGCQFPALRGLGVDGGSAFLYNAIAAVAARFSEHPSLATGRRSERGNVFYARARGMLGDMLGVPSRETVLALVLLAHVGFGNDSESEEWMFTGMAVRMAIDLGLHLEPPLEDIEAEDRTEEDRLDRLAFWSVLLLDYALCFGTGRTTTFRPEEVTRRLPDASEGAFAHAARLMRAYGPLINLLNAPHQRADDGAVAAARATAVAEYNMLPANMVWSASNLQAHTTAHTAPAFLHIHLWLHTVLASGYLAPASRSGGATPGGALWRNSARTIGDVLVLSDVIGPGYLALPFANQAFYVAGCCYIKDIEATGGAAGDASTHTAPGHAELDDTQHHAHADHLRSMLASVAGTSIATLRGGLARQAEYWAGVGWVGGALAQRLEGIRADEVDLARVNEELETYVSVPEGVVKGEAGERSKDDMGEVEMGEVGFGDLDLLLPFELGFGLQ